jgi:hypothetical protein
LEDRIAKVEGDVNLIKLEEERKSDREIIEKINQLKEYINTEIATLSTAFNLSL